MDTEELKKFLIPSRHDPDWIEYEKYYLCKAPQKSQKWLDERKYRLTASNFGTAGGMDAYCTDEELYQQKACGYKKEISEFGRKAMDHGILHEDTARIHYEKLFKVKVEELGLVVPKWDPAIGASVDGVILGTEGIIEIKCPVSIYKELHEHRLAKEAGKVFPKYYKSHIKPTHYCQIQGCLFILDKKWCDYVVYYINQGRKGERGRKGDIDFIITKVERDEQFWNKILYPAINNFTKRVITKLAPKLLIEVSEKEVINENEEVNLLL